MKKVYSLLAFLLLVGTQVFGQTTITGTVTSAEDDFAIPGATVVIEGVAGKGTSTDFKGHYTLDVPANATSLVFSFIGMKNLEVGINGRTTIDVVLEPSDVNLEEVVVVAFGTTDKKSFTGAMGVISNEKLEKRTVSSITQAIEGSTTGVQVTSASGQPGSSPAIRIRGFGTLNGSASPLYIVDGAQYEGSISNINMEDVESMTILKDAASTALYGSRAANGVIMITTKKGKMGGAMSVSVKSSQSVITQAISYYETADPEQYYELMFEAYKNSRIYGKGDTPEEAALYASEKIYDRLNYNPFNVDNDKIVGIDGKLNPNAKLIAQSLDWYSPLEQVGSRQNHTVSISGGGEKHDIMLSLAYLDEKGYVKNSHFKRLNSRMNFNARPTKWLKMGSNFSAVMKETGLASGTTGNTSYGNPFFFARNMASIYPVYIVDPTTGEFILDAAGEKQYDLGGGYNEYGIDARPAGANPGRHIIAELDYNNNKTNSNHLSNRTFVDFTFIKGLNLRVQYAVDLDNYKNSEFENQIVGDGAPAGRFNQTRYMRTTQNFNQLLSYKKSLQGIHNFDLLLGHESFQRDYTRSYGMKSQLIVEGIYEFDNFVTPTNESGYSSRKTTEGYFGRLNYNFNNKYYVSGSYRFDGSSVFSKDVRWGGFYSVGASWLVNKENFLADVAAVDLLKLRASYGEVGNDAVGSYYAYQALYSTFPNAETPGLIWSDVGNSDLTWETNKSYDVALDFALFGNKINGSVEFYHKTSADLLYNMPLPLSMGLATQPRNIATLYNEGFEYNLGSQVISTKNFSWNINLMASTVKNEITEIPDPFISGSKRWAVGHSVYDYYLYDYYGVNPETGAAMYYKWIVDPEDETGQNTIRELDENGDFVFTEKYTDSEKGYVGASAIPDLFGSISNSLRFRNFHFDFLLTYGIGGKVLDYNYAGLMNEGEYGQAIHVDQINGWRKDGDVTTIPRLEVGNSSISPTSSRWLTDASYLAVKNVSLSYDFNFNKLHSIGVKDFSLFVSGENLLMFNARKGMDSQQSFSGTTSNVYLPSRIFTTGLNIKF